MKVTVKYFGSVKDEAGTELEFIEVAQGSTVSDIISAVKDKHTDLKTRKGQIIFALNQNYSSHSTVVKDGDEIALFPVVSGG